MEWEDESGTQDMLLWDKLPWNDFSGDSHCNKTGTYWKTWKVILLVRKEKDWSVDYTDCKEKESNRLKDFRQPIFVRETMYPMKRIKGDQEEKGIQQDADTNTARDSDEEMCLHSTKNYWQKIHYLWLVETPRKCNPNLQISNRKRFLLLYPSTTSGRCTIKRTSFVGWTMCKHYWVRCRRHTATTGTEKKIREANPPEDNIAMKERKVVTAFISTRKDGTTKPADNGKLFSNLDFAV